MATTNLRERKPVDYAKLQNAFDDSIYGNDATRFKVLLDSKLPSLNASAGRLTELQSTSFNLDCVRRHGLKQPVLIHGRDGLGMRIPCAGFCVRDVARVIGESWPIDVIDVSAQSEMPHTWTLGQWARYYHSPAGQRKEVYNVISLEFSGTPLTQYVRSPRVIRQMDWIDTVWPGRRRAGGEYPAVQYYCLMSVAGSWTDFHVDFGGTSVWYHVHTGSKQFVFAPPTPGNLAAYEAWIGSPAQSTTWLPDVLPSSEGEPSGGAFAVTLPAGATLLIPSGWIHAVYTPQDSLVFGGNYLHGQDMSTQLRIYELELSSRVGRKYRFPYYEHIQWYAAGYYLQFTRLPAWRGLLRGAMDLLGQAQAQAAAQPQAEAQTEAGSGPQLISPSSLLLGSHAAPPSPALESLLSSTHALGLSLHELTGLPSLLRTLAHLREGLLTRQREESAAGGGGGVKLKLKIGGGGTGTSSSSSSSSRGSGGPKAQGARIKGALLAHGSRLHGEDEYSLFPASAAATEAAAIAGVTGGPEALLDELASALDPSATPSAATASTAAAPAASVLAMHRSEEGGGAGGSSSSSTAAAAGTLPLYNVRAWRKGAGAAGVKHLPEASTPEDAALQAAAVGAACSFGLYGGALPLFPAQESGVEESGQEVVQARVEGEQQGQGQEEEEQGEQDGEEEEGDAAGEGADGRPPAKRARLLPQPQQQQESGEPQYKEWDESSSGEEEEEGKAGRGGKGSKARTKGQEEDSDEEYQEGEDGSEAGSGSSSDDDEEDEEEEEGDVLGEGGWEGEAELEGDGEAIITVAGAKEERLKDEAVLAQLEAEAERKRQARAANRAAAAELGNVRVLLSSSTRKEGKGEGEGGGKVRVQVATSGAGHARKLLPSSAPALGTVRAPPPGGPTAITRPLGVKAVGYRPVTSLGAGVGAGGSTGEGAGMAGHAPAAPAPAPPAPASLPLASLGGTGTGAGGARPPMTAAQRLQAALKAKGLR